MSRKFMGEAPLMEKKSFIKEGEPTLANYDWRDIASGQGIISYYAAGLVDATGGAKTYKIEAAVWTPSDFTGAKFTSSAVTGTDFAKFIDLSFYANTSNIPRTIEGECLVQVPFGVGRVNSHTVEGYVIAKIGVYDGTTTTTLATMTSRTISRNTDGGTADFVVMSATIAKTNIKIGDQLVLIVEGWAKRSVNEATHNITICHNPLDAQVVNTFSSPNAITFPAGYSQLKAQIPFRIEL
jgi:hypothetical protein